MNIKKGIRSILRGVFLVGIVFVSVFLYHSHFEPFRNTHPEYFRWISEYDVPNTVTVIERKEQITVTESDFVSKLIVSSQNVAVTVISSLPGGTQKVSSGFFITNDGVVVAPTKDVLFGEGTDYFVFSVNGEENTATLIGSDPFTESSFFRTEQKSAPALTLAPQDAYFVGRNVVLLGRSLQGNAPVAQTSTLAELAKTTNIAKQSVGSSERYEGVGWIKNGDRAVDGSAVVTYQGELLGMTRELTLRDRVQTAVIPASALIDSLNTLNKEGGAGNRPFLGISYVSITPEFSRMYNLPVASGAWVKVPGVSTTVVLFGSPAYTGGIRQGDIITAVNEISISIDKPLSNVIAGFHPGDTVQLKVYRDGSEEQVTVTLGDMWGTDFLEKKR
jgi:S1-C subfamily serine protease